MSTVGVPRGGGTGVLVMLLPGEGPPDLGSGGFGSRTPGLSSPSAVVWHTDILEGKQQLVVA